MSRRSSPTGRSGRSKPEKRTQESENESDGGVDISPDEISVNAGAIEIGIDAEGELSVGIEVPTPVPGVTATGGIVIDTQTGEITEISVGAEIGGVTGVETTLKGCNVITTFYVEIPNTNIRFSYDVISELPNCKIEEEKEKEPPEEDVDEIGEPDPIPPLDPEVIYILFLWYNTKGSFTSEDYLEIKKSSSSRNMNLAFYEGRFTDVHYYQNEIGLSVEGYGSFGFKNANQHKTTTINKHSGTIIVNRSNCTTTENYRFRYPFVEGSPTSSSNREYVRYYVENSRSVGYADCSTQNYTIRVRIGNGEYIEDYLNSRPASDSFDGGSSVRRLQIFNLFETFFPQKKEEIKPQPPRKMDKCCKESLKLLEEIHEALGCEELLDKKKKTGGFEVPRRLLAPGGRGEVKHHNYLEIFESTLRAIDYAGFKEFDVQIKDVNAAVKGNQEFGLKITSLTGALKAILEILIDTEADGDVQTNMNVRNAFTVTNILTTLAIVARDVQTIRDGLGIPFVPINEKIDTAFDVTCGQVPGKGFNPKTKNKLDLNDEENTESLLPDLLKTRQHPIRTTEYKGGQELDIRDLLIQILLQLKD